MCYLTEKVSVIVTVYNLEKYIYKCLSSIIEQTHTNLEIICVNDGSTDSSSEIIKNVLKLDKRVVLLDINNSGVTKARYNGLMKAGSEYVMFVDGDDTLPINAIECLLNKLKENKSDICVGGYTAIYSNNKKKEFKYTDEILSSRGFSNKLILGNIMGSPCMRIYKKTLFQNSSFNFHRDIIRGEDLLMNLELVGRASSISVISDVVYNYYIRTSSTMGRFRCSLSYESRFRSEIRNIFSTNKFNDKESEDNLNLADLNAYIYAIYSNIINGNMVENDDIIKHINENDKISSCRSKLNFKFKMFYYLFCRGLFKRKLLVKVLGFIR